MVYLATSLGLTYLWNLGSLLGMTLVLQIITGTLLVFYYNTETPFESVQYIMMEVNSGWLIRLLHFNGASLLFILMYLHIFKGLFYKSYRLTAVWLSGLVLLMGFMAVAFMGYTLVWGQMSFWAAVVITSLLSVIPSVGQPLVYWLWGGFIVSKSTLKFFFTLHFLLPYLLLGVVVAHLYFLHATGSTNVLYVHGGYDKVPFYPYYWWKDAMNLVVFLFFFLFIFSFPFFLGDPEMFMEANPMVSPAHIVPEWYFLFAYGILRAIPNKVLGVFALVGSLTVLALFPFSEGYISPLMSSNKLLVWTFLFNGLLLSWLGQSLVEYPFVHLSLLLSVAYFLIVLVIFLVNSFNTYLFSSGVESPPFNEFSSSFSSKSLRGSRKSPSKVSKSVQEASEEPSLPPFLEGLDPNSTWYKLEYLEWSLRQRSALVESMFPDNVSSNTLASKAPRSKSDFNV